MSSNKEIKAGAGYMIGNILIKGVSFITLPIFSRLMTVSDFGLFNTYVAYEAILTIFIGLGVYASIKNAKYDYKDNMNEFLATISTIILIMSVALGGLSILFNNIIFNITGFSLPIILMLVLQSFGATIVNILNAEFSLEYNYKKYLIIACFNTFFNVGLSLLLIVTILKNDTFLARVVGSFMPLLIIGIFGLTNIYSRNKTCFFNKKMAKYALIIGIPLVWHFLSQQVSAQFDRIMITKMKGAEYTGIYSFVYTIANIFTILFYSTDNVWSVWFFKKMESKEYDDIHNKSIYYMLFISCIAIGMMIGSREIILVMGSKKYVDGINLVIPIIVGMYFLFLYTLPVGIEYYYKKTKYIAMLTFISALLNIVLNYVFINIYGYKAAAYTTAVSYFVMFISHWFIAKKILKDKGVKSIYKFKDYILFSSLIIVVGLIVIILNQFVLLKYILFVGIFVSLVIIFKRRIVQCLYEFGIIKKKKEVLS